MRTNPSLIVALAVVLAVAMTLPLFAGQTQEDDSFRDRLSRIDRSDTKALYDLALWCQQKKKVTEFKEVLEIILRADPDHEGANKGLGRVKFEGSWMTRERRAEILAARRAEKMKAFGLVEYQGAWVTLKEREMLEKGMVFRNGRWVTPEEVKSAEGYLREDGQWVKKDDIAAIRRMKGFHKQHDVVTAFHSSDHFVLFSEFGDAFNQRLAGKLEKGYRWFETVFGKTRGFGFVGGRKIVVAVFDERGSFESYVAYFSSYQENMTADWSRQARQVLGFAWWDPDCYSVTYRGPREEDEVAGQILHQVGHILINRKGYNFHFLPPWLDEGFSALLEFEASQANWAFCIQGRNLISSVNMDDLFSDTGWIGVLDSLVDKGYDPPFSQLMIKSMDQMDADDVAKAMGLVRFLVGLGEGKLAGLLDLIQRHVPREMESWNDPFVVQVQLDALSQVLGATPEEVELAFQSAWIASSRQQEDAAPGDRKDDPGKDQ